MKEAHSKDGHPCPGGTRSGRRYHHATQDGRPLEPRLGAAASIGRHPGRRFRRRAPANMGNSRLVYTWVPFRDQPGHCPLLICGGDGGMKLRASDCSVDDILNSAHVPKSEPICFWGDGVWCSRKRSVSWRPPRWPSPPAVSRQCDDGTACMAGRSPRDLVFLDTFRR